MTTAHLQISHADVVIINKCDVVAADQLELVKQRVRAINGLAKLHETQYGQIPQLEGVLLDLHAYDRVGNLDSIMAKGHSHLDPTISTLTLQVPLLQPGQLDGLEFWLRSLLWDAVLPPTAEDKSTDYAFTIHRVKGQIPVSDDRVLMIQGVRDVFEIADGSPSDHGSTIGGFNRTGKIVLIGRGLGSVPFEDSLVYTLERHSHQTEILSP
ncbi:MAG: hypothetical protein Q9183_007618 [Haloplaca sp. 2 TL-2023]